MRSSKTATIDPAVTTLEQRIANRPDDGNAHYQLAVLLLAPHAESYFWRQRAVLLCRPRLMKRMSRTARAKLVRQVKRLTRDVQQWLDGFEPGKMSDEAAAYMYLLQGLDEMPFRSD